MKFSYAKLQGKQVEDQILELVETLPSEKTSISDRFISLKNISKHELMSHALIQLKNEYCDKNKCLKCAIGNKLLVS